jgi:hypothetical protein
MLGIGGVGARIEVGAAPHRGLLQKFECYVKKQGSRFHESPFAEVALLRYNAKPKWQSIGGSKGYLTRSDL